MPELPEVTTTVNGLNKVLLGLHISDAWTDLAKENPIKQFENTIKNKKFFNKLKKKVTGAKVIKIERKAKNILIYLDNDYTILIHLKMTGHLIFGRYEKVVGSKKKVEGWIPDKNERKELCDPYNRFIHFVFSFSNNQNQLVFCDTRKFGKITIFETNKIKELDHDLNKLGPEPLDNSFTFEKFQKQIQSKNGKIKTILMNQAIISGIGNIYSDEMLWLSDINPLSDPKNISEKNLKTLFSSMKKVLLRGIKFGGDSTSDYRNIDGARGNFQGKHNVYKKKNEKCGKIGCRGVIIRKVIDGRSAHFCSLHQKLF